MQVTQTEFREAILFLMDIYNKSETTGDIVNEIEFTPAEIHPYKILTNAGNLFEQYSGLESYDELHNYLRKYLGDLHDYDVGMPLMTITAVCDAITNVYQSIPSKMDKNLGSTKNNNIRDLILYYSKSAK